VPIKRALIAAGYSEAQASASNRAALRCCEEGRRWTPEAREALIRGRLIWNVIHGVDHGVRSAKLLGGEKNLSMWRREDQQGIVIVGSPKFRVENGEP